MKLCPHCRKPIDQYADDARTKGWKRRMGRERWNPRGNFGGLYKVVRVDGGEVVVLVTSDHKPFSRAIRGHNVTAYTVAGAHIRLTGSLYHRSKAEAQIAAVDAARRLTQNDLRRAEEDHLVFLELERREAEEGRAP